MNLHHNLFITVLLCLFLFAGCEKSEIPQDAKVYRLLSNNPIEEGAFAYIDKSDFIDYQGNVTHQSQKLAYCSILDQPGDQACSIDTMPFLASESQNPDKMQILNRLIVSDKWMADNFAQLLDDMPAILQADMYQLFASTTAIVIHKEIRPAFFWSTTGAIYLDPNYLWFSQAQKDSISQAADYRSDFASQLQFMGLSRYSLNNEFAFSSTAPRNTQQTLYALSALLFHELAHANDFFPSENVTLPQGDQKPITLSNINDTVSLMLDTIAPLTEEIWHKLAQVMWVGVPASSNLKLLTASDVGALFAPDGANDGYAYLESPYSGNINLHFEDTAMLFEEAMMKIHFDIDREIAFATPLVDKVQYCSQLRLDWTTINRYREDHVINRVQLVIDKILPDHNHSDFLQNPPPANTYSYCLPTTQTRSKNNATNNTEALEPYYWH